MKILKILILANDCFSNSLNAHDDIRFTKCQRKFEILKTFACFPIFNQSGHKRCRDQLDMGGQTSPPISKYFSEILCQSHIKLTNNKPNKDFESVEKFKLDRKIFSSWKIKISCKKIRKTRDLKQH